MRLLWLAADLRAAGLAVVEHAGWQDRVRAGDWSPRFGVVHATAAPRTQSDADQVRIVRDGRSGLPGPIAVACVDRTARWHVLGSGRCNTTLSGTAGPFVGLGNTYALGVEACNDNGRDTPPEPWPPAQYAAYVLGWSVICRRLGWTAANLVGHKEHTPGHKTDPTFSMTDFRTQVDALLGGGRMATVDDIWRLLHDGLRPGPNQTVGGVPVAWLPRQFHELRLELAAHRAALDGLAAAGGGDPDVQAILTGVDERLAALRAQLVEELPDAVVDEERDRLAE